MFVYRHGIMMMAGGEQRPIPLNSAIIPVVPKLCFNLQVFSKGKLCSPDIPVDDRLIDEQEAVVVESNVHSEDVPVQRSVRNTYQVYRRTILESSPGRCVTYRS